MSLATLSLCWGFFSENSLVPDIANGHLAAKPSSDKDSKVDSACGSGSISKSLFQVKTGN